MNESLHSVLWSRCPKERFVGRNKLQGAAALAVAAFNSGASHLTAIMTSLGLEVNEVANSYVKEADIRRIKRARQSSTEVSKRQRKEKATAERRERAALSRVEGPMYGAGNF